MEKNNRVLLVGDLIKSVHDKCTYKIIRDYMDKKTRVVEMECLDCSTVTLQFKGRYNEVYALLCAGHFEFLN